MADSCICGRRKTFELCCGRFLIAGQLAKTPEQLMRSRYAAYALGGYGDYLLATWFAATASALSAEALSEKTLDWQRLEVLSSQQNGDKAEVEFRAYYRQPDQPGLQTMHEISVFQRSAGRWFYVGGEVSNQSVH
jgi:SEC-C motif-containing protein